MSLHRRAARRDTNEREIIEALIVVGASVQQLSVKGCPDLLVGYRGVNWLMEVKTDKGELTEAEFAFMEDWEGQADVVRSVDEALEMIGAKSRE